MKAVVIVNRPGREPERLPFVAPCSLGAGASRDLHVPEVPGLLPHQLDICPEAKGCLVTNLGPPDQILHEGRPFRRGTLAWGAALSVRDVELRFERDDSSAERLSLLVIVLAVAGIVAVFSRQSSVDAGLTGPTHQVEPEHLFGNAPACRVAPGEAEAHRAQQAAAQSHAKMQRYAFDPSDGLEAVNLMAEAAACARKAGAPHSDYSNRYELQRETVWRDFQSHQLRLDVARREGLFSEALGEVRYLNALWPHPNDEMARRLRRIEHALQRKLESSKDGS